MPQGLRYGRIGVLSLVMMVVTVAATVSCGGAAGSSSSESLASVLPAEATSLPLQPNAPAVGGDVQAPLHDVAKLGITEAQAKGMAADCRNASEIVADSECTTTMQDQTENAPPCAPKDLCITAARVGVSMGTAGAAPAGAGGASRTREMLHGAVAAHQQRVRYVIAITDERPGRPLCADAPGGLCFVLPADDEAAADIVNNARFAQSTLPEPSGRPSSGAGPSRLGRPDITAGPGRPETAPGEPGQVSPTPETPPSTEPPVSEPVSPPVSPPLSPPSVPAVPTSPASGEQGDVSPPSPAGT